jgi:hypothetical protein
MAKLLVSLGVFVLLFALSALFIFLLNHFFPSTKNLLPRGWQRWMSSRFVSYYFLVAMILIFLGIQET